MIEDNLSIRLVRGISVIGNIEVVRVMWVIWEIPAVVVVV